MIFGEIATVDAEGAYLAHAVKTDGIRLKKGHLVQVEDISKLLKAGIHRVIVARLQTGDVHEQDAALRVGAAVAGIGVRVEEPFTGRVNLFATHNGLMIANERLVSSLNKIHPAVTIASLENYCPVEAGRMVATVKIIPFAAPEAAVEAAEALGKMVRVATFKPKRVVLVATMLEGIKLSTMDKTRRVLEKRLALAGSSLVDEIRVNHQTNSIMSGLQEACVHEPDLIILFGASATVDVEDVGPAGLVAAGGQLLHFGMPVDPGNLLFLGNLNGKPVIGAPGCARSPAENGFDWVLNRLMADLSITGDDIMGLGVGGLLMEITSRPQPREGIFDNRSRIAAIVLAAGRSTRMGGPNKLLATIDGVTLVRQVVEGLAASTVDEVIVVTGHMVDAIKSELSGLDVRFVHNPDFADGLSTSLVAGIDVLDDQTGAALIALGDMPFIDTASFNGLLDHYRVHDEVYGVVATSNGKRGNPVLWSRRFFEELKSIRGDTGARHLIGVHEAVLAEVEIGEAATIDLDTPEALAAVGGGFSDKP